MMPRNRRGSGCGDSKENLVLVMLREGQDNTMSLL